MHLTYVIFQHHVDLWNDELLISDCAAAHVLKFYQHVHGFRLMLRQWFLRRSARACHCLILVSGVFDRHSVKRMTCQEH